jgi:uncharacterized protein (DUF433 family)
MDQLSISLQKPVVSDNEVLLGKPTIKGTRILSTTL